MDLEYAKELGRAAWRDGQVRVPTAHPEIAAAITGLPVGGGAAEVMSAFLAGWDEANLAGPVHEPGFPSPRDLEQVLAHLKARQESGPTPATGLYWMTETQYRACIAALRDQGYEIAETIVAGGDRAANETGYMLVEAR